MPDCVFCDIIAKKIPADVVYENSFVLAFKDSAPQAPNHFLVIPKKHIANFNEIFQNDSDLLAELMQVINNISIKFGLNSTGFRIVNNCGANARQTVNHLHFHILAGKTLSPNFA